MGHIKDANELLRQHTAAHLGEELDFFYRHKSEWLSTHRGQFVLIGKGTFGGFYPSYSEASRAGAKMFGLITPFFIEEVCD